MRNGLKGLINRDERDEGDERYVFFRVLWSLWWEDLSRKDAKWQRKAEVFHFRDLSSV